jgi:hypothetical protein
LKKNLPNKEPHVIYKFENSTHTHTGRTYPKKKNLASKLRLEVLLRRKNWPTLIDNEQLQNKGIQVAKSWWKSQIVIVHKALRENL